MCGDEGVDLFELDDVGPVGDDPVAPGVLSVGGGGEVLMDVGVGVAGGESFDDVALVGWGGLHELFELVAALDEVSGSSCRRGEGGLLVAVVEPDPVVEGS